MGHSFGNKLYFTRDIPKGKWVPKDLLAAAKPPTKRAKPPTKSATFAIKVWRLPTAESASSFLVYEYGSAPCALSNRYLVYRILESPTFQELS